MSTFRIASLNFLFKRIDFANRLTAFKHEIMRLQPDIICLQEVNDGTLPELTQLLTDLGYPHASPAPMPKPKHWQVTFTRNPAVHQHLDTGVADGLPVTLTVTKVEGRPVHILNAHLIWGGNRVGDRLRQVTELAAYAAKHANIDHILLAGDLNTDPTSAPIQYLTGQQPALDGTSTYWVDACTLAGGGDTLGNITSEGKNPLMADTAINHDLDPALLPARRIDYILSHGWRYGNPGTPMAYGRFADVPYGDTYISDHYGIWTDISL